jgi:hypothetical protein
MNAEKKVIKFIVDKVNIVNGELFIFEEVPDDEDMVLLELTIIGEKIRYKGENFFSVLQDMRKELESKSIQIFCNGSAKNIYPSPMQLSMGSGRTAYKLSRGQQARNSYIVDISECDEELEFVSVNEQMEFYNEWVEEILQQ